MASKALLYPTTFHIVRSLFWCSCAVLPTGGPGPSLFTCTRPKATDSLTDAVDRARCLTLLADLALDPGCARTLFRGGAVPQMLLNAQGCSHAEVRKGNLPGTNGSVEKDNKDDDRGASMSRPASPVPVVEGEDGVEGIATNEEAEEIAKRARVPVARAGRAVEFCRCRQAMRLLTRLVRGLPGEAPAVVVRHPGLRSIVELVEAPSAPAEGTDSLPAEVDGVAGGALEVGETKMCFKCVSRRLSVL